VAKDGATLPPQQTAVRPARQLVSVGETYDFQIQPSLGQLLWLEVRRPTGEWVVQAPIRVRSAWILPAFDPLLAGEVIK
jgi:hypothetical protein